MRILVVGQGIAGTALAWALMRRGVVVHVADGDLPHAASSAAAGLINPITGKFYVKTWGYDAFFPVARRFYTGMEAELGVRIWFDTSVLRLLHTPKAANDWAARTADPAYAPLMGTRPDAGRWQPLLRETVSVGETKGAARVDLALLLHHFRRYLVQHGLFWPHTISPQEALKATKQYDAVVFCEGWQAVNNPLFPDLPWRLTLGEALLASLQHPEARHLREVIKRDLLLIPVGEGRLWVGATYRNWSPPAPIPEPSSTAVENELQHLLQVPYQKLGVQAGIRPGVRDRRPLIGNSPFHPRIFLFNGLGTKGTLLAPYWAEHLARHLLEKQALDPVVRLRRA